MIWLGDAEIGIAWGLGSTGLSLLLAMGWGPAFGGNGKTSSAGGSGLGATGKEEPGYHK